MVVYTPIFTKGMLVSNSFFSSKCPYFGYFVILNRGGSGFLQFLRLENINFSNYDLENPI